MSDLTIHQPPIEEPERMANVIATTNSVNGWRDVKVIDLRPYWDEYRATDSLVKVMVDVRGMRFTPDEAREYARLIWQAADYAEQTQRDGG